MYLFHESEVMRLRIKKIFVVALAICLLMAIPGYAFATGFNDVQGHWAETQINQWADKGLATGYEDGSFKPEQAVTRAEFVTLVNRAFGIASEEGEAGFADVAPGQWYYESITAAKAAGYISGYPDGTFKPNQNISRQEAAVVLARLLQLEQTTEDVSQFTDAAQIPAWSSAAIAASAKAGLIKGYPDGTFNATRSITRAETVVVLDRALDYQAGAVDGVVTMNGLAVSGATVRVFQNGSYEVLQETTTGSDGKYKLELQPGAYDITAATENEVAYAGDVKVTAKTITATDLKLAPAAVVSGVLKDKNGKLVKNTTILFTTNPTFVAKTDSKGEFTVQLLPGREYTVRAYEPDKAGAEPQLVKSGVKIGPAGKQTIGTLNAPFDVTTDGGNGGPSIVELDSISITPDIDLLNIGEGEQVSLKAILSPANTTQTGVNWIVISGQGKVSLTSNGTTATVLGLAAGDAQVKVVSTVNNAISDTITIKVVKAQKVDVIVGTPTNLKESNEPVKVMTTVTVGGQDISLAIVMPGIQAGTTMTVAEVADDTKPANLPFVGLDLDIDIPGGGSVEVTVELPVPDGLNVDEAGAFHFNGQVWEFRDAAIVDGKLVFKTTLSPVAVSEKVPPATDLAAQVGAGGSVTLSWTAAPTADSYAVFRDNKEIASVNAPTTTYTDKGLPAGEYTYFIKAYREVAAGASGKTIKFESAPSNKVTVKIQDLPKITKFAGIDVDSNTIDVPLNKIGLKTSIEVSMDSSLALNVEGLGVVRQLNLVAGRENNIDNIIIPAAGEIDVSDLDLDKLCQATKDCPPATKQQILNAVNFTGLFELADKPGIKSAIIEETDLSGLLTALQEDDSINKGAILDAIDFAGVINAVRDDKNITRDDIFDAIQFSQLVEIVNSIEDEAVRKEILDAIDIGKLIEAKTKDEVFEAVNFKALFNAIIKTDETVKDDIIQTIDYTKLLDLLKKSESATKDAAFNAIRFTDLIDAISNTSPATIEKVIEVAMDVINIMQRDEYNITRSDIINNINFNALDKVKIFNWLSCIDGDPDVLTIEAILTDKADAENVNKYTININR
jgi:hypothetical protein